MYSILYVDDEADLLELGRLFLEQYPDLRVETHVSANEALASPHFSRYDAIVSDYQMPEMDGIEFLKVVRKKYGDIPFILFTGRGREEIIIQAINNGVDFYLQKGGDVKAQFAELAHKIRQAVLRRRAEVSLVESEKRLADIINFLPDATFAINRDGVIIAWNRAIEEMTGLSSETMLGKGDHEYALPFYGERRPILIDHIFTPDAGMAPYYSNVLRAENTLTAETNLPHPKGTRITVLAKAGPLYNRQGEMVGAIEAIRDITERTKADDELRAAYEQITASEEELREQFEELVDREHQVKENALRLEFMLGFYEKASGDEKALLNYAVEGAGVVTESPLGYLAFLNDDESELSMYAWSESSMEECSIRDKPLVYKTGKTGLWGEAVRQRKPVITNDYAAPNPAKKGYPGGHPEIVRHMNIPIIDGGHIVMVAGVANKPEYYTDEDVKHLSLLMQGLWQVIRQRKMKADLEKSEVRFRAVYEGSHDALMLFEGDRFIDCNPQSLALFGFATPREFITLHPADLSPEFQPDGQDSVTAANAHIRACLETGEDHFEWLHRKKDGSLFPAEVYLSSLDLEGRKVIQASIRDITGRKRDGAALRESEERYRTIFENIQDVYYRADCAGNMILASPSIVPLFGYDSLDEILGKNLSRDLYMYPEQRQAFLDAIQKDGSVKNYEVIIKRKDGKPLTVATSSHYFYGDDGTIAGVEGTFHDLTSITEANQEIRLFAGLIDLIPVAVIIHNPGGQILYVNPGAGTLHGYTRDELLAKNLHQIVVPESNPLIEERMEKILSNGEASFDVEHFRKDGSRVPLHITAKTARWKGQDVIISAATDLSDRMKAEQILAESEERYRLILENIQDGYLRVDAQGLVTLASPSAARMVGYPSAEDLLKKPVEHFYHTPGTLKKMCDEILKNGHVTDYEAECVRKDGSHFWVSVNAHSVLDGDGNVAGYEGVIHDITERRGMEYVIREANRKLNLLNSITRHDVTNQLTILQGFAQIASLQKGNPVITDYLTRIISSAEIIARQIEFTRTYQELGVKAPSWTLVEDVIALIESRVPIRFSKTCSGIRILADPMLERVFFNLFENAARHGGGVTQITVRCEREPDGLLLIVEDDGNGVPALEKEKIFVRGYGKNTGLGLFLSREILSLTGITIKETGIPGKGARFEMLVPKGSLRFEKHP